MLREFLLVWCAVPLSLCAQSSVEALGSSADAAQRVFDRRDMVDASNGKVYDRRAVDVQPAYPGGEKALQDQLLDPANCGALPDMEACFGSSRITFDLVVNTDGTVSDVKFTREGCTVLHPVVHCALRGLQRWTPGQLNGAAVRVRMRASVRFDLR
ncbi:MAG: hypothetical protein R2815_05225 [Flavobacteriales bacterium]|nr:hypothetical protein [Flavobacteriales bacterium]